MAIKSIKVWSNPTKTDWRVYVKTDDGREGCKYLTGNGWHQKGEIEGDLTSEDWAEAKSIAVWDKKWHTVYENEIPAKPGPCPDCGGDCGPNCEANLPHMPRTQTVDYSAMMIETGRV